jgi:hypothetical protein
MKYGTQDRRGTKEMQADRQTDRQKTRDKKVNVPYLSSPKGQNRLCGPTSVYRGELPDGKAAEA